MSHSGSRLQLQCCGQSVAAGGRDAETEAGHGVDGRSEWLMKTESEPCWAQSVLLCRRLLFASALLLIIFPTVFLKELEERNVPRCLNLRKCTAHLWAYEEIVLIINQNFSVGGKQGNVFCLNTQRWKFLSDLKNTSDGCYDCEMIHDE